MKKRTSAIPTEKSSASPHSPIPMHGFWALSPLLIFLAVYALTSILAHDFYKVPVTAGFLIASVYALCITRGAPTTDKRISIFSRGAGDPNVMLMIWIFVLAGAFASTAKEIGALEATVQFTLHLLPGKLIYAGLFLAACFISMAVGTSVGTTVALVPIAAGIATEIGSSIPLITGIVVGGAFFGDNLSFISDTTVAATKSQGCSMKDKFWANLHVALPAALLVTVLYILLGRGISAVPEVGSADFLRVLPYLLIIVLALLGMNVIVVLAIGVLVCGVIGGLQGTLPFVEWMAAIGTGIASMGELIIVSLLAGGLLALIRYNGGMDYLIRTLTRRIHGPRGAALSMAALVSLVNVCTANNTIAIITSGPLARDIAQRYNLDPKQSASILDTFSCLVQGLIPYGAQMLMASGLAGVSALSIIRHLYYPLALGLFSILAILLRFRKS